MNDIVIGCNTISWETCKHFQDAFSEIAELGYKAFEVLNRNTIGFDGHRRRMLIDDVPLPFTQFDYEYLNFLGMLSRAQDTYKIQLSSLYFDIQLTNREVLEFELANAEAVARFLEGMGAKQLVVSGGPYRPLGASESDYLLASDTLNRLGRRLREFDMELCFHPHLNALIETREDLDRLFALTDPNAVYLCIDTAHLTVAGSDVVGICHDYIHRTHYFHFADVRPVDFSVIKGANRLKTFCGPGEGIVDFPAIVKILRDCNWEGTIIAEIDPTASKPKEAAASAKKYFEEVLGFQF